MNGGFVFGLAAVTDVAIAIAYGYAGFLLARRAYPADARRAGAMFALWWWGIAATGLASTVVVFLANLHASPRAVDAVDQASLAAFAVGLVGFTSYVAYIHFGSYRADLLIIPGYVLLVAWSVASAIAAPATGYHMASWRPMVERPPNFGPPPIVTSILLLVPLFLAAGGYAWLYRRSHDGGTRFRVVVVTGAFIAWVMGVSIVSLPGLGATATAQIASRMIILFSAGLIVMAYRPPTRIRAWLGHADAREELILARRHLEQRTHELL